MKGIKVIQGGLLSTFQDGGRKGFRNIGQPSGGVMDLESQYISNALVSKDYEDSVLELTAYGLSFEALTSMVMAVTGAKVKIYKNNIEVPMYQSIKLNDKDIIRLESITEGLRSYIAFSHDLILERGFNSESTDTLTGFGGYKGRALKAGDCIEMMDRPIPALYAYEFKNKTGPVHVILSYDYEDFDESLFFNHSFKVSNDLSRMGMKLEGKVLKAKGGHDIISSPVCPGTIQIPGSGQPIILLKDGQTTGGYKRIGCVIYEDLNRLSQFKPGDSLVFKKIDVLQAKTRKKVFVEKLKAIKNNLKPIKTYAISINEKKYYVAVEEKET